MAARIPSRISRLTVLEINASAGRKYLVSDAIQIVCSWKFLRPVYNEFLTVCSSVAAKCDSSDPILAATDCLRFNNIRLN